jgi:hypothetical protein
VIDPTSTKPNPKFAQFVQNPAVFTDDHRNKNKKTAHAISLNKINLNSRLLGF